nr:C2 domain-containing protein At1g53590-like isoform X2 [Tanacetum cinerariifolium]
AVNENGVTVNLVMDPQNVEDSGPESPSKKKVKDVAKSILKPGNSARSMKHALSGKGSKMRRDADLALESDTSSFEGSFPSATNDDVDHNKVDGIAEELTNGSLGEDGTKVDDDLVRVPQLES